MKTANSSRSTVALAAAVMVVLGVAGCSKSGTGTAAAASVPAASASAAVAACGSSPSATPDPAGNPVAFNNANLGELDQTLACALKGKSLSGVNIAMVVNVAADYWNAGEVGFKAGCKAVGLPSSDCTFFAPPNGTLTEQNSELETLRSQNITGYSISAIDPASAKGTIATDVANGINVLAIDSPLPGTAAASLYLGTDNYAAGFEAGTEMKAALGSAGGKVAILVGSLTAANATGRIAGFEAAIKGSNITVVQKVNDNLSASTAQTDAETILANNTGINGLYGVYSYDGPALAQAVLTAKKTGTVKVVCDDSDTQTLGFISSGAISGTVVQMPYEQGFSGAYILAAEHVLGTAATMELVKPYLESDGSTLSSGVGLITNSDLSAYTSLETQLGIS
jgi:ribose transport system substrate-binding protein